MFICCEAFAALWKLYNINLQNVCFYFGKCPPVFTEKLSWNLVSDCEGKRHQNGIFEPNSCCRRSALMLQKAKTPSGFIVFLKSEIRFRKTSLKGFSENLLDHTLWLLDFTSSQTLWCLRFSARVAGNLKLLQITNTNDRKPAYF